MTAPIWQRVSFSPSDRQGIERRGGAGQDGDLDFLSISALPAYLSDGRAQPRRAPGRSGPAVPRAVRAALCWFGTVLRCAARSSRFASAELQSPVLRARSCTGRASGQAYGHRQ